MARTRWPSDLGTPASSPGRADQTGSAGGCQKTWGPADKSSRKTARRRQPNRRSGRDPGPLTLRPRRLTVRGTGARSTTHTLPAEYLRLSRWAGTFEYHARSSRYVLSQRPGGSGRCRTRQHVLRRLHCGRVERASPAGSCSLPCGLRRTKTRWEGGRPTGPPRPLPAAPSVCLSFRPQYLGRS
jgi:hypothetical protein